MAFVMGHPSGKTIGPFSKLLVCSFILIVTMSNNHTRHVRGMPVGLRKVMERCCKFDLASSSSPFNTTDCFRLIDKELNQQEIKHTRSFKYMKKLWRFVSIATKKHEKRNDNSIISWGVNALKPELATRQVISFNGTSSPTFPQKGASNDTSRRHVLTRLELLVPYCHVRPSDFDHGAISVSYNGETFPREESTIPFRNMLVFSLALSNYEDASPPKRTITLNMGSNLLYIHSKGCMLLEYYNMNQTITDEIRSLAMARASRAKSSLKETRHSTKNQDGGSQRWKISKDRRNTRAFPQTSNPVLGKSIKRRSAPKTAIRPCKVSKYIVDARTHLDMRFIIQPLFFNIGKCSGKCNSLDFYNTNKYSTGRSVILNLMNKRPEEPKCVPDVMRTTVVLIMEPNTDVKIFNVESSEIASCRCA